MDANGQVCVEPIKVLQTRSRSLRSREITDTYLKTIGKSKALVATLSDTKPEDDFDNENDGILNAFTAIVNPIKGIVEDVDDEEDLVDSKFRENG